MSNEQLISFDYAIKYVLRDKSDLSIIEGFLTALLATAGYKPVKVKALLDSESNKEDKRGKRVLADMVVEDADGVQYIIEIERNEKYNFMHKACFSSSRCIVDSIGQGQNYSNIAKIIHISLLYFDVGGSSLYHGKTIIRDIDKDHEIELEIKQSDGTIYHVSHIFPEYFLICVPSFHDEINRSIDEWLYMMKHEHIRDDFKEKYIKLAAERLRFLQMSMDEQTKYMKYQLEMVDVREEINTALVKGKVEGRIEGRIEEKLEIVKRLLDKKVDINIIVEVSGLSKEEIDKLEN